MKINYNFINRKRKIDSYGAALIINQIMSEYYPELKRIPLGILAIQLTNEGYKTGFSTKKLIKFLKEFLHHQFNEITIHLSFIKNIEKISKDKELLTFYKLIKTNNIHLIVKINLKEQKTIHANLYPKKFLLNKEVAPFIQFFNIYIPNFEIDLVFSPNEIVKQQVINKVQEQTNHFFTKQINWDFKHFNEMITDIKTKVINELKNVKYKKYVSS